MVSFLVLDLFVQLSLMRIFSRLDNCCVKLLPWILLGLWRGGLHDAQIIFRLVGGRSSLVPLGNSWRGSLQIGIKLRFIVFGKRNHLNFSSWLDLLGFHLLIRDGVSSRQDIYFIELISYEGNFCYFLFLNFQLLLLPFRLRPQLIHWLTYFSLPFCLLFFLPLLIFLKKIAKLHEKLDAECSQ